MTLLDDTFLAIDEHLAGARRSLTTAAGPIYLQTHCSPLLIEQLRAEQGLRAFARQPEREHGLLLKLARDNDAVLTLAYTPEGEIIGQVSLAPVEGWWHELKKTHEIAFEVSSNWRRMGIARHLLDLVFEMVPLDDMIVLGMGLHWHWDMGGTELSPLNYRSMLERLCASYGFMEYLTSEPNINMHPANIFLARLGRTTEQETVSTFFNCLLRSDTLPGM
ncbi:GNAT family N-acetyltransferase [Ktedonospora formicarum]|uniref:Acetoin dehydrogenase n=1 Tax=Ktedonospora formicarum TaxID=2778364 RepID=A0A8J3I7N9_9CHLR|nr:GNAT family N-acetyltransferase [Ktedonospora formicarum]GHO46224.1 acetoin dehydrogenase [Ktedonospora formicarum]